MSEIPAEMHCVDCGYLRSQPVDQFASKALEIVMSHIRTKPADTVTPERVVLSSEINE